MGADARGEDGRGQDRTVGVCGTALWAEERGQVRDRGRAEEELAWGRAARRRWPMAGHTPMRRRRWDERAASSRSVAPEVEDACVLALRDCVVATASDWIR